MTNQTASSSLPQTQKNNRGSAFIFCLVLAATAAAVVSAFLGRTLYETNRVRGQQHLSRARWRAIGQLELAKNIVLTLSLHGRHQ